MAGAGGEGAAMPGDGLPEADSGSVRPRRAERAPAAAGGRSGTLLRAAAAQELHRKLLSLVRKPGRIEDARRPSIGGEGEPGA